MSHALYLEGCSRLPRVVRCSYRTPLRVVPYASCHSRTSVLHDKNRSVGPSGVEFFRHFCVVRAIRRAAHSDNGNDQGSSWIIRCTSVMRLIRLRSMSCTNSGVLAFQLMCACHGRSRFITLFYFGIYPECGWNELAPWLMAHPQSVCGIFRTRTDCTLISCCQGEMRSP